MPEDPGDARAMCFVLSLPFWYLSARMFRIPRAVVDFKIVRGNSKIARRESPTTNSKLT